jgi:ABC-type antimicrobial peptide transport system permease subunit
VSLLRYAFNELRGRLSRTIPTLLASVLAVSSFVVLTGTVERQRLEVTQLVEANARGAYDILVRPKGATSDIEASQQIVREDYLSGVYGGITLGQVKQIQSIPGVEVAAPIAMLGITWVTRYFTIDMEKALNGRDRVLLRFSVHDRTRNGTVQAQSYAGYFYLTRSKLVRTGDTPQEAVEKISGKPVTVCLDFDPLPDDPTSSVNDPAARWRPVCQSPRDKFSAPAVVALSYPLLVAAVDPQAEDRLLGLDAAKTSGRSLDTTSKKDYRTVVEEGSRYVPAVVSNRFDADYQSTLTVDALPDSLLEPLLAARTNTQRRKLVTEASGTPVETPVVKDATTEYVAAVREFADASAKQPSRVYVSALWQTGQIRYTAADGVLHPVQVPTTSEVWQEKDWSDYMSVPVSVADTSYREVTVKPRISRETPSVFLNVIGQFDPAKVHAGDNPSGLLGSYSPEPLLAADAASSSVLGGERLRSDLNPAGYIQNPPALLVSLDALDSFYASYKGLNQTAPVSAVRIRVAGVTGVDPVSRERIRVAAEQIHQVTGLDVDITLGSSVTYRTVALPATTMGTPAIQLKEAWVKKGVAVAISDALDTKSLALFILVVISAALTVAIAATASVRARHRELAILSCLGWRPGRLRGLVLTEALVLGLVAGVVGAAVAVPVGRVFGVPVDPLRLWLAVPIACVLNVGGAWAAAVDAGRSGLLSSVNDVSGLARRLRVKAGGPVGVGISMLAQRPRHVVLGGTAVAVGAAAVAMVMEVNWTFAGTVVGSVLGDAVAVQTHTSDLVAVALLAVLAFISVAVVLFTGAIEDAQALAALRATGWRDRSVVVLITSQGAIIGLVGALVGLLVAVTVMALAFGASPAVSALPAAIVLAAAVLAAAAAALPVARRQAGRSLAASLSG